MKPLLKRLLVCTVCLLVALGVTSLAAMELLIPSIDPSPQSLAPTPLPLLLMGLLLIGVSMVRRTHRRR